MTLKFKTLKDMNGLQYPLLDSILVTVILSKEKYLQYQNKEYNLWSLFIYPHWLLVVNPLDTCNSCPPDPTHFRHLKN